MTSKICRGCGAEKDLADLYKNTEMADGHFNKCKSCVKARAQKYRREHLEQYAQYEKARANLPHRVEARRKYQEEHKEQIAQYKKIWTANNKESVKTYLLVARSGQRITPKKTGKPRPTIFAKGGLRGTPVVGTLPFRSSKNSARVTATNVWLAAITKPYWRLTMSCL